MCLRYTEGYLVEHIQREFDEASSPRPGSLEGDGWNDRDETRASLSALEVCPRCKPTLMSAQRQTLIAVRSVDIAFLSRV